MSEHLVSERYVRALSASVEDDAQLERTLDALDSFAGLLEEHAELHAVLQDPAVPPLKRRVILDDVLSVAKLPEPMPGLLRTLFDRNRLGLLSAIRERFAAVVDERLNRVTAQVTTATKLSAGQERNIRSGLSAYSGKTVRLETEVDEEIIGGVVVRLDGSVIDGSLRARLDRVKHALLAEEK